MKPILLTLGFLLVTTAADARARVVVTPPVDRTNAEIICPWVAMSVPPETPAGHYTLGVCPPRYVARPL